jgi:hypothetical protein
MAFERMGGVEALALWGRQNPDQFYALYARLIPSEPPYAVLDVSEPEKISGQ